MPIPDLNSLVFFIFYLSAFTVFFIYFLLLLVVVDKELERLRPSSSRTTPGNTPLVKFVFSASSDDDGGLLSLCDPNGDGNDNESLKSFSKTSVCFLKRFSFFNCIFRFFLYQFLLLF